MSLIRIAFWACLIIMLMPTDERGQEKVAASAGQAVERAATFCERNPSTCAAGAELWATFVRKAEFTFALAVSTARDYMSKSARAPEAVAAPKLPPPASPSPPAIPAAGQPASTVPALKAADGAPAWRAAQGTGKAAN